MIITRIMHTFNMANVTRCKTPIEEIRPERIAAGKWIVLRQPPTMAYDAFICGFAANNKEAA